METFAPLAAAGASVRVLTTQPPHRFDAAVDLTLDGERCRFFVEFKSRAPFPSEVPRFLAARPALEKGIPLLVAPHVSEAVGEALVAQGWSWIDEAGNYDIRAPRIRLSRRLDRAPRSHRASAGLPHGPGSWGIIRFLVSHGDVPLRASHLANVAGVTQPRASQVLSRLVALDLAERTDEGWAPRRDALLDAFLHDYPGPGGPELHYFTLESLPAAATAITQSNKVGTYVSADVAADLIAPWRHPTHLIIYGKRNLSVPSQLAVKAKGRQDANITVRIPHDHSVFCFIDHSVSTYTTELRLAEHTQIIWDLLRLGGDDRRTAATEVRKWLLRTH